MTSRQFTTVRGAELRAKQRMPRSVYRAFAGLKMQGATLRDNVRAFSEVGFRPHAAVYHEEYGLATTVLGRPIAMPVIVSPMGALRLAHRDAEPGAARAAGAMGVPVAVSTMASRPIHDVVAATSGPVWYQLYLAGGRAAAEAAIARADAAGCAALVVTVDLLNAPPSSVAAVRDQIPTRITLQNALRYLPEMVVRPQWLLGYAREGLHLEVPNVRPSPDARPLFYGEAIPVTPTWRDIEWIRDAWPGPLVVKGIIRPDDARRAVDAGARAVVVSNHGGLALDQSRATLRALPGIVEAVHGEVEILLDGGIREGADVVKALALGARAVLCGRACVWGLGADGSAGVQRVLRILRDGIERTLAGLGCASVHDLSVDDLDLPAAWPARTSPYS
jgi:isopentenyl diphosphate isomerase/L-lactate dehydrogenase-like FMN-dependent dehydrogenase